MKTSTQNGTAQGLPNLGDSGTMSTQTTKAEQLLQNVFSKTAQIVIGARRMSLTTSGKTIDTSGVSESSSSRTLRRMNKWVSLSFPSRRCFAILKYSSMGCTSLIWNWKSWIL